MNIHYENDLEKGAGFGLFHIDSMDILLSPPINYTIQRSSDGKYLGNATWLDAEERLQALEITNSESSYTLHVPPEVINQLDNLETYRFTLMAPGVQERAVLSIPDTIIYGGVQQHGHIQAAPQVMPIPLVDVMSPVSAPEPEPEPEPAPEPEPIAMPESKPEAQSVEPASSSLTYIWIGGCLLALLIVGILFVMLMDKEPDVADADNKPSQQEDVSPSDSTSPVTSPDTSPDTSIASPDASTSTSPTVNPVVSPKGQVRVFATGNGSAKDAYSLAQTMPSTEEGLDARFLLLEIAAQGNILEAMVKVAKIYDPNNTAPTGTIIKDAEQAHYWYNKTLESPDISPELLKQVEDAKSKLPNIQ